jgi:hypothetical protein
MVVGNGRAVALDNGAHLVLSRASPCQQRCWGDALDLGGALGPRASQRIRSAMQRISIAAAKLAASCAEGPVCALSGP